MKRALNLGCVAIGLLALVATASADPGRQDNHGRQRGSDGQYDQWHGKRELYQKLVEKLHKPKPIPIDPGRGDGHMPLEPPTPQGPPGFVFVNGHWERVKAPAGPTVVVRDHRKVAPNTVVIRDHRKVSPGTVVVRDHRKALKGTVVVRDHRKTSPGTVVVRDHRTDTPAGGWQLPQNDASSQPGGVSVVDSPEKNPTVIIRDHRGR